jgi:hypothetical protein
VFIKAPTPPTPTAANIQLPGQDEQKTLIYVLVKKPDEAEALNIQQPAPTQPSKPEVYFIKYKTQKQVSTCIVSGVTIRTAAFKQRCVGKRVAAPETKELPLRLLKTPRREP